jgi:hypothetical protein
MYAELDNIFPFLMAEWNERRAQLMEEARQKAERAAKRQAEIDKDLQEFSR